MTILVPTKEQVFEYFVNATKKGSQIVCVIVTKDEKIRVRKGVVLELTATHAKIADSIRGEHRTIILESVVHVQ